VTNISPALCGRYSAAPSEATIKAVVNLHRDIRQIIEDASGNRFTTFLQGSYRNGTALPEINDVDIITVYDPGRSPAATDYWTALFEYVAAILAKPGSAYQSAEITDKCIAVHGTVSADVVPALASTPETSSIDPIQIFSRRVGRERDNYPRKHFENGVRKQADTKDAFKPAVRMLKRWARQYDTLQVPSYYLECAVYSVPDGAFRAYDPLSFASVATKVVGIGPSDSIPSIGSKKNIRGSTEWCDDDFAAFQEFLWGDLDRVFNALEADTSTSADRYWSLAFGDL